MKQLIKLLLITLLLGSTLFANEFKKPPYDKRLDLKVDGKLWYDYADTNSDFAYNLGVYYDQVLKEYKTAEFWYKKSWDIKPNKNSAFNLGHIYKLELQQYTNAIKWYKMASDLGDGSSAFSLALLYENNLQDYQKAIKWYKTAYKLNDNIKAENWYIKAIKIGKINAIKNLGRLYHYKLHDDVKAATYFIALIDNKYPKKKVITYLKTKWNLSDETIKQGYEAQLKSKIIPEKLKYRGGI
ncbi:tetratricopeptide repeat protein [Sulfurimonas sp.]|uniref:tetratricopeptide repeat protein n=1 Tax=Sulfurimonas sp. TaxID=2022749 RepID=UPI003D0BCC0A